MSNLKEIKNRISSISSVIKITTAMNMIAVARFSSSKKNKMIANHIIHLTKSRLYSLLFNSDLTHTLSQSYKINSSKKLTLIVLTSDKGFCGNLNSLILKQTNQIIKEKEKENVSVNLLLIGKKAFDFFTSKALQYTNINIINKEIIYSENANVNEHVSMIMNILQDSFLDENHTVDIISFKFKSLILSELSCERFLPFKVDSFLSSYNFKHHFEITECNNIDTLKSFILNYFKYQFVDTYYSHMTAVFSSRMQAMDNSTKNGQELKDLLVKEYNYKRQSSITNELIDIVSCSNVIQQ